MSHSTTATATYILAKYSRSYPTPSGHGAGLSAEWQHFVNPVIQLTLEAKKSNKGELESVRLRILWIMNSGNDLTSGSNKEVCFEDIDLLSFSPLKPQRISHQSLPLKAVYKDAVVGIRYLCQQVASQDGPAVYRRFQITFTSASAASQFVDSIRVVCPCKANPTAVPAQTQGHENISHNTSVHGRSATMAFSPSNFSPSPVPFVSAAQSSFMSSPTVTDSSSQVDVLPVPHSSATFGRSQSTVPTLQGNLRPSQNFLFSDTVRRLRGENSDFSAGVTNAKSLSVNCSPSDLDLRPPSSTNYANSITSMPPPPPPQVQDMSGNFLLSSPNPPLPSSTNDSNYMSSMLPPPPPCPPADPPVASAMPSTPVSDSQMSKEAFLASLRETPTLYDLSQAELEQLVGEVIREEGFVKLLESLDKMWRVKGYLQTMG